MMSKDNSEAVYNDIVVDSKKAGYCQQNVRQR